MSRAPRIAIDLEANVAGLVQDMRTASQAVTRFTETTRREVASANQQIAQLGKAVSLVGNFLRTSFAGLETTTLLATLAGLSDRYQNLDAKLKLATRSQAEYKIAQEGTRKIATETFSSLESTVGLYQRVSNSVQGLGVSQQQILKITETVNRAFLVSGATSEEAAASIVQLTQSFGSGYLRGQEFNSIAEQAPRLLKAIAETMHVPLGALKSLANEGKITRDVLIQSFTGMASDKIAQEATNLPLTIGRAFGLLRNSALVFVGEAAQTSGAARDVAGSIKFVADNFAVFANAAAFMVKAGLVVWFARLASAGKEYLAVQISNVRMAVAHAQAIEEDARRTAMAASANATAALEMQKAAAINAEATAQVIALAREEEIVKLRAAQADMARAEAGIAAAKAAGAQSFALRELAAAEAQLARAEAARSASLNALATLGAQASRMGSVASLGASPGRFSPTEIASMNAGIQAMVGNAGKISMMTGLVQKLGGALSALVGGTTGGILIGIYALYKGFSIMADMMAESRKQAEEFHSSLKDVVKTADYMIANMGKGDAHNWIESYLGSAVTINQRAAQIKELQSQIESLKEAARFDTSADGAGQLGKLQLIAGLQEKLRSMQADMAPAQQALANMGDELSRRLGPSFDEVREKARTMNEADFSKFENNLSVMTKSAIGNLSELSQHIVGVVGKLPQTIVDMQRKARDAGLSAGQKAKNHLLDLVEDGRKTNQGADYYDMITRNAQSYVSAAVKEEAADKAVAEGKKAKAAATREANQAERDAQAFARTKEAALAKQDELNLELITGKNLTESKKDLIKFEHLLATTKNETLKAHAGEVRAILEENIKIEDNVRAKERAIEAEMRYAQVIRQVNDYLESRRIKSQREIEGIQSGGNTAELNSRLNEISDEFRNERKQIDETYRQDLNKLPLDDFRARNDLEREYRRELGATVIAETQAVAQEKELFAQKLAAQQDWKNGAKAAFEDYIAAAGDVAGQTRKFVGDTMQGLENLIVQFVTTGKASFKDFIKAVLTDWIRMETRILLSKVFAWVMQMAMSYWGGGGTNAGGEGAYGTSDTYAGGVYSANGNAFNSGNVIPFSTGASFTNGIYSKPTVAPMAMMGEGGKPEAVIPLARDSRGQLGVTAAGMGGSGVTANTSINITINQDGSATAATQSDGNQKAAREFAGMIEQKCREVINREQMPGGSLWKMKYATAN